MKKYGGILGTITLLLLQLLLLMPSPQAKAADCETGSDLGAVRLFLPELSTSKQYALWLRLQSPDSTTRLLIERNNEDCFEIDQPTPLTNQWFWLSYETDGQPTTLKFEQESSNSLLLIGTQPGVKVDRVLLTDPDCIPQDFGSNCKDSVEAISTAETEEIMIKPPSSDKVQGKISLSITPTIVQDSLKELRYVVDGRTLQTYSFVESFDTTLVTNGQHTVHIEILLTDGSLIREATVIDVDNPENALTPAVRWVRLNQKLAVLTGSTVAGIIILLLLIGGLRGWLLRRRRLHFHGF